MFVVLLIVVYFLAKRDLSINKLKTSEILFFIYLGISSLTLLISQDPNMTFRYILGFVFIGIMYLAIRKLLSKIPTSRTNKIIKLSGIIILISNAIYYLIGLFSLSFIFTNNGIESFGVLIDRGMPRLISLFNNDPNITVLFFSIFYFYYICNLNQRGSKLGIFLSALLIILTFSRGGIISIILSTIIALFIDQQRGIKSKIRIIVVSTILFVIINSLINYYTRISITEIIFDRFTKLSSDNGSGRYELWINALQTFREYPILGIGTNATLSYNLAKYGTDHYIHNVFLEILSETGIVGITSYLLFILATIRTFSKKYIDGKTRLFVIPLFISILLQFIFISAQLNEAAIFALILINNYIDNSKIQGRENQNSTQNNKLQIIQQNITKRNISKIKIITYSCYGAILKTMFNLFPINNNKVLITSYYGKGFGDNGKYITNKLLEENQNILVYWATKRKFKSTLPENIKYTSYLTPRYFYHLTTAKIWINNSRYVPGILKRKQQFYIQTWHGGIGFKKCEKDAENSVSPIYLAGAKNDAKMTNLMISNSKWLSNLYRKSFWYEHGKILEVGLPRNDILVQKEKHGKIIETVKKAYGLKKNKKIFLYAPTFRNDGELGYYKINLEKVRQALKNKTGEDWVILVRLHPNISSKSNELGYFNRDIVDATSYPDMQELIMASNAMMTDYSSCLFDFALNFDRPAFLYTPDYDTYTKERGFYFDYFKLPFSVAQTENELISNIENFNQKEYNKKITQFKKEVGLNETGHSSEKIAEIILEKINEK